MQLRRVGFLILFASAGLGDLAALTVTVEAAKTSQVPASVAVSMRRADGDFPARMMELPVGTPTVIENPGDGTWEIAVKSPTFWAAPVYGSRSDAVTLRLWPMGSISGKLSGRPPASGDLLVSFAPAGEASGPSGVILCPFTGADWRCALPAAGELDLRFNLTGFATEFRWAVKVDDAVDIGALQLTPGSSVSGRVRVQEKSKSDVLKAVEISLSPLRVEAGRGTPRYTARPDARGFFQIRGLAPGSYSLVAQGGELVSDTRTVEIIQQTNASLKEPLVIAKPARLSVTVTPSLDPRQQRWQVLLLKKRQAADRADLIDRSLASPKGEWSMSRVLPGEYLLEIQQEDGAEWRTEDVTLRAGDGDRSIDIALSSQRVRGTVKLGSRPIAATVRFGGENAPPLNADDQGRFEGEIPPLTGDEGRLLVSADTPYVQRTLVLKGERSPDGDLRFDVSLPATTITGRTLNEDGSPEPSAIVTLQSNEDDRFFEQMFSETDGSFQFDGFDPGTYVLQAEVFQKASAMVKVEASTDPSAPVNLVLRPLVQVRGQISMKGVPIAGAHVYALSRDTSSALLPKAVSDAAGRFIATLPPGTKTYDVIVYPRGFYVTGGRITRDPRQPDLRVEVGQDGGSLTVDAPDDEEMLLLTHAGGEYSLSWVAHESGGTESVADGVRRFTIPNLESGAYSVCRKQKCASVFVPRSANATLTLER